MIIKVNGEEVEVADGSTIQEVIDISDAPYTPGSITCLIKGKKEFEKNINKYKIKTTKGSIIIELIEEEKEAVPLIDIWKSQYKEFIDLNIRWTTSNEVAIGPIVTDLDSTHDEYKYFEGDVLLSLSSFSNESTHIIFIKENISNVYSVPPFNKGIFARIIGGKKTLELLTDDDKVLNIEPIVERSTISDSSSVSDLNTVLEDENELFTYVSFDINENSPICVEHIFSVIKDGRIKVNFDSTSFLGFYELEGIDKPQEDLSLRSKGTITVRNTGKGVGKVYIYRENRVLAPSHTTVGTVKKGMEIVDIAKENDFITIKSEQERIMTLNTSQKEAGKLLSSINIEHIREGVTDDDALIVEQNPKYTIDILREGKLTTKGINKEDLCEIEFVSEAPRSLWYFKSLTNLLESPIGFLKVHFAFPGMKLVMFEGDAQATKGLIPENIPGGCIKEGAIGITNMSRKNVGLIGVRFEPSEEFGPTAEPFNGTNIVGYIVTDLKNLEKIKEGEILYVKESLS